MRYEQRRNRRAVASLREKVVLLREEGLSYGKIAETYGISKSYTIKLVQQHRGEMRRVGAGHVALTAQQCRFARALVNGRSPQEAALSAARPGKLSPEEAHEWAHMTMWTEKFRLAIRQIFRLSEPKSNGATTENPVATHPNGEVSPVRPDADEEEDDDVVVYLH